MSALQAGLDYITIPFTIQYLPGIPYSVSILNSHDLLFLLEFLGKGFDSHHHLKVR